MEKWMVDLEERYVERYKELASVMEEKVNKYGDRRNDKIPRLIGDWNAYLNRLAKSEDDGRKVKLIKVFVWERVIRFTEGENWTSKWFIQDLEREFRLLWNDVTPEEEYKKGFNQVWMVLKWMEMKEGKDFVKPYQYWVRHYKNQSFVQNTLDVVDGVKSAEEVDQLVEYKVG